MQHKHYCAGISTTFAAYKSSKLSVLREFTFGNINETNEMRSG